MAQMTLDDFRVQPGQAISLPDLPTEDTRFFTMGKSKGRKLFESFAQSIDELNTLFYAEGKHRLLVVFQAMDTGGKDGTIKHVFEKKDPQSITVAAFKKPNEVELSRDYLHRIHEHVPADGQVTVFNRSHYEDIVAVRVREIYPEERWRKRYEHIKNFEQMLADEGTTIIKVFLNISRDEQRERLQGRLDNPDKHWKFNPADLTDRALWPKFMEAYSDVISATSTEDAPWYVVPANRKWQRNLIVARIVIDTMRSLDMKYPEVDFDPAAITIPE